MGARWELDGIYGCCRWSHHFALLLGQLTGWPPTRFHAFLDAYSRGFRAQKGVGSGARFPPLSAAVAAAVLAVAFLAVANLAAPTAAVTAYLIITSVRG